MARIKPKQLLIQSKTKKAPSRIIVCLLALISFTDEIPHRPILETQMDLARVEHVGRSEDSMKTSIPSYAVIDTAKGSITIEIYKDASADVVDRFVSLW
ncbi:hypothetical protein E2562_032955 [Oryza meyeriana var. granulata]|uniref:Uncharacterized protein n=1 Tax=Oryza meyeriana var. granulata TaxID=110450 RepID=A0A6G1DC03_9ORYZ|nr:hypothetical protein E2562_032955 [Oryza meyeriana var. granulata]